MPMEINEYKQQCRQMLCANIEIENVLIINKLGAFKNTSRNYLLLLLLKHLLMKR